MNLNGYASEANRIAMEHGFWDDAAKRNIGEQIALMHSELSEALEEYRTGNSLTHVYYRESDGKPEGFGVELADLLIRVFDTSGFYNIDLDKLVQEKMKFNESRPHMHGKIC